MAYGIFYIADCEGDWCRDSVGRAYDSPEAAQEALDADESAQPDEYGNKCYPEIVELDDEGWGKPVGRNRMLLVRVEI